MGLRGGVFASRPRRKDGGSSVNMPYGGANKAGTLGFSYEMGHEKLNDFFVWQREYRGPITSK